MSSRMVMPRGFSARGFFAISNVNASVAPARFKELSGQGTGLRYSVNVLLPCISGRAHVGVLVAHAASLSDFDHYIVIAGLSGNDFIYNDAAYLGDRGYGLLISPSDLERAWDYSSIPRHGMAISFKGGRGTRPDDAASHGRCCICHGGIPPSSFL